MSEHLHPGKKCPACERRVPYPKKDSSPVTRVVSYRVPVEEYEAHKDTMEALSRYMGTFERPNWMFSTLTWAAALALQDPESRDIAGRNNWYA